MVCLSLTICIIVVGGNRRIAAAGDDNGMIGGHSQRVPGAAGATQAWETAPGKYTLGFGASVEDIRATAPYQLSKQFSVKCHDVMRPDM